MGEFEVGFVGMQSDHAEEVDLALADGQHFELVRREQSRGQDDAGERALASVWLRGIAVGHGVADVQPGVEAVWDFGQTLQERQRPHAAGLLDRPVRRKHHHQLGVRQGGVVVGRVHRLLGHSARDERDARAFLARRDHEDVDVDPLRHDLVKDLYARPEVVLDVGRHRLDQLYVAAGPRGGQLLDVTQDRSFGAELVGHSGRPYLQRTANATTRTVKASKGALVGYSATSLPPAGRVTVHAAVTGASQFGARSPRFTRHRELGSLTHRGVDCCQWRRNLLRSSDNKTGKVWKLDEHWRVTRLTATAEE